jgi:hypothetical protein
MAVKNGAPPTAGAPGPTPPEAPAPEGRLELIRAYQARAAGGPDPLAANLGVIAGDLMLLAYRQRQIAEANLAGPQDPALQAARFARDADRYLRFVAQLHRLTQLNRQLAGGDRPAGPPQ